MFTGQLTETDAEGLLTPREEEAMNNYHEGHIDEISATLMGCSTRTVRAHMRNACIKLGAMNRQMAATICFIKGYTKQKVIPTILIALSCWGGIAGESNPVIRIQRGGGARLVRVARGRSRKELAGFSGNGANTEGLTWLLT